MELIDLRSDTVTKPCHEMLEAMFSAQVGDDVFEEDPTVIKLENKLAKMFGKEAAIFCPSGTMANQVAIKVHCQPGDEVICHEYSHVYKYEGGGLASNAGCSARLICNETGVFDGRDVQESINPDNEHFPVSKLVVVENSCNRAGGVCFKKAELESIEDICKKNDLKLHLDGARFFNALVAQNESIVPYTRMFNTISICLSKGLGAPVGSVLIGGKREIRKARRIRKSFGGGMRQAGYLAAAGLYAIDRNIKRLEEDHLRAKHLGAVVKNLRITKKVLPIETNIVIFEIDDPNQTEIIINNLKIEGVNLVSMGPGILRFVTHLDFNDEQLEKVINILNKLYA